MSRLLNYALSPESLAVVGRELDGLFEQLFGEKTRGCKSGQCDTGAEVERTFKAPIHIWEKGEQLCVLLELPGVAKEDVSVTYENGTLEIVAEKKSPDLGEHKAWYNTIVSGVYKHRVSIGEKFNPDSIEASLTDGLLRISVQRKPEIQPRKVEIS